MNKKVRKALTAVLATAAVTACTVRIAADYQAGTGFNPFTSDRALLSNQILFPDSDSASGLDNSSGNGDSSFWEQDDKSQNTAQPGQNSGYLFGHDKALIDSGNGITGGNLIQGGEAGPADGPVSGDIYEITDRPEDADLIISGDTKPGGNDNGNNDNNGSSSGGVVIPGGNTPAEPDDNGGSSAVTPAPSIDPEPVPDPL